MNWKRIILLVAIPLLALGIWLATRTPPTPTSGDASGSREAPPRTAARPVEDHPRTPGRPGVAPPTLGTPRDDSMDQRREEQPPPVSELQRRIARAYEASRSAPPPPATRGDSASQGAAAVEPSVLKDRTGRGGTFAEVMNNEFMPLASECVDMAQERNPELVGLLALEIQLVPLDGDKALITSVTPTAANEIDDPALYECMEQSAFSIEDLHDPRSFEITMPLEPPER